MALKSGELYQSITDQIIQSLEAGVAPWTKPWNSGQKDHLMLGSLPLPLRSTGEYYRGINVIILWLTAQAKGYTSPNWMTFKQVQAKGGNVKKGEKGTVVVYANRIIKEEINVTTGDTETSSIPYMKGYVVFNADQCDNLAGTVADDVDDVVAEVTDVDAFFANTNAKISYGGDRAFYVPGTDRIRIPAIKTFKDKESFHATKAHEFIHWTGHESRLHRTLLGEHGSDDYAREELVAELGSAFLCSTLGIVAGVRPDHASYIGMWLKALRNDRKFIFSAATKAQAAVDHLKSYQSQQQEDDVQDVDNETADDRRVEEMSLA